MIRGFKGLLAVATLAGLGLALRWMTAGSYGAATSHDLDSLTVLAVATVAWIAYAWLALAVTTTVLEQLPGALGTAASALAARLTTQTARTLLRTTLGLAAATPMTLTPAHATPINHPWTEPRSTLQPTAAADHPSNPTADNRRPTEPRSTLLTGSQPTHPLVNRDFSGTPDSASSRTTEPASTTLTGTTPSIRPTHRLDAPLASSPDATTWRTTEPPSTIRLTGTDAPTSPAQDAPRRVDNPQDVRRAPSPQDKRLVASPQDGRQVTDPQDVRRAARSQEPVARDARPQHDVPGDARSANAVPRDARPENAVPRDARSQDVRRAARPRDVPGGGRVRVGVPDRPTAGAAVRYTDLRSGQPVRVPRRVVVKAGDTLWSIAAAELGPDATPQDVASRWPAWYAANRQLIGPDPDLIRPGQVLRIPPPATGNPVPPTHQEK